MSRTRFIKPGFFTNDTLAEVSPIGRLLFAGLWTIADRAGRLEDRPKKIKAEVLPFDNANVDRLLGDLAERGFIVRYESGGQRLIQIQSFAKHQSPHPKEPASLFPAADESVTSHSLDTDKTTSSQADPITFSNPSFNPSPSTAPDGPRDGDLGFRRVTDALTRLGTRLNALNFDDIGALLDEGYRPEWFEKACFKAAENDAKSWAYVRKVVIGWGPDGPPPERSHGNGAHPRRSTVLEHPDDEDPLAKRLRLDAERRERERQLGVS